VRLSRDQIAFAHSLLRDSARWVQLDSVGVEPWFEHGLVDARHVWTSAAGAYAVAVAEDVGTLLLAAAERLAQYARADSWQELELPGPAACW
jgi:phosphoglycerate dehydrogenase-like enzyme